MSWGKKAAALKDLASIVFKCVRGGTRFRSFKARLTENEKLLCSRQIWLGTLILV